MNKILTTALVFVLGASTIAYVGHKRIENLNQDIKTVKQKNYDLSRDLKSLKYDYNTDVLELLKGRKDVSMYVTMLEDYEDYVLCASIDHTIDCMFVIAEHTDKDVLEYKMSKIKTQFNIGNDYD